MTPRFRRGQMWDALEGSDLFCLTTNSFVRRDGALVMGRGIALEAAQRFPTLQIQAGRQITAAGLAGGEYGVLPLPGLPPLVLFQVKYHFKDAADPALIERSSAALCTLIQEFEAQQGRSPTVHLNFPGIGAGWLQRDAVTPLLEALPACVTVWEYGGSG